MHHTQPAKRIIWSVCHTGLWDASYIIDIINRAADQNVSGIELSGRYLDSMITYRGYPQLQSHINESEHAHRRENFQRICDHAAARGLRLGVWHHEISATDTGGKSLLELMPQLRARDGLIDLENLLLYQFITDRISEFLELFPAINEIILTMIETAYPVTHRPFCDLPPIERIRRVIAAALAATESHDVQLVVRPLSDLRSVEENVRKVLRELPSQRLAVMYKTEPFDWHPFLMNEPFIDNVPEKTIRAEVDTAGEYYGQTVVPCCFVHHLHKRFAAAMDKGATEATLRVDRGTARTVANHPVNEVNLIATTRWLQSPGRSIDEHILDWIQNRYMVRSCKLASIFNRTFDVIKHAMYLDQQSLSHHRFPTLEHAKHIQVFGLFEPGIPLTHMARNWGVLSERCTISHEAILAEKQHAVDLADQLVHEITHENLGLSSAHQNEIQQQLIALQMLAHAMRQWCRVIMAHCREMWGMTKPLVDAFELENQRLMDMSRWIDRDYGDEFFGFVGRTAGAASSGMGTYMRTLCSGLTREREAQKPLQQQIAKIPGLLDAVLCGFASEGHCFSKKLHTGGTPWVHERCVRKAGLGETEIMSYTLAGLERRPMKLIVTLPTPDADKKISGIIEIGTQRHSVSIENAAENWQVIEIPVSEQSEKNVTVSFWSTSPEPFMLAQLVLMQ